MSETITILGKTYQHKECIHDFAGNNSTTGDWADTWESEDGAIAVTVGGDWIGKFKGFAEKEKARNKELNEPWDVTMAVAISEAIWRGYSLPDAWTGEEAQELINLIGDATRLQPAFDWVEARATYEEQPVKIEDE